MRNTFFTTVFDPLSTMPLFKLWISTYIEVNRLLLN